MEGLTAYFALLDDIRSLAMKLTAIVPSLTDIFDREAISLNRRDQVSRLRAIQSVISQQLDEVKRNEEVAQHGYSKAKLKVSLGQLAVGGFIKVASHDDRKLAFSNGLLQNLSGQELPFGRVYIAIGSGGFPAGVGIANVSRVARELKRAEPEILRGLREKGYLLLKEWEFAKLIDKLAEDIQEGHLLLPIATKKLPEIINSSFKTIQGNYTVWTQHPCLK